MRPDFSSEQMNDLYLEVVEDMREAAREAGIGEISDARAHAAARNFVGFYKTLLEIKRDQGQAGRYEQYP